MWLDCSALDNFGIEEFEELELPFNVIWDGLSLGVIVCEVQQIDSVFEFGASSWTHTFPNEHSFYAFNPNISVSL